MNKINIYLALIILAQLELFSAFGIKVGSYPSRPNIPPQIQQLGLSTQIVKEGNSFSLYVGNYNTQQQAQQAKSNFNIQGSVSQIQQDFQNTNNGFAVEVLSARNMNTIPKRIISQVFSSGMSPVFIMDKGLYRLVVGPFKSDNEAKQAQFKLSSIFGREVFIINIPFTRFASAISPPRPTPAQLAQDIQISSNDSNEHIGFLEEQRAKATSKYSTRPYGATAQRQSRAPFTSASSQQPIIPAPMQNTSGLVLSVSAISSKHDFSVNGKQIVGKFSPGLQIGYKANDNTLFQISYHQPETKKTTVFIQNTQQADISSTYSFLGSAQLQYRYFFPTHKSIFVSSNIGIDFVKQQVTSNIPLNFGTSYTYNGIYVQSQLGLGAGYRIGRMLTFGFDYNAYLTLKTITRNMKIYVNLEF